MKTLITALKILPALLAAIRAVEEAFPLPGQGKKKLDLVLDILKAAYDASAELTSDFSWQNLLKLLVPMIEKTVALYNGLGIFQKSSPPENA